MRAIRKAYHIWRYGSTNCKFTNSHFSRDEVVLHIKSGCGYTVIYSPLSSRLLLSCHDSLIGGGGNDKMKVLSLPAKDHGVKQVSCGGNHFMVLATNGTVFGFGSNCFGQCGVDRKWTKLSSLTQVEGLQQNINQVCCGLDHSLFLDKDHNVTACGWSADGQTGTGCYDNVSMPTHVVGALGSCNAVQLFSGADTCFATTDQGRVFGWGNNEYGQLGGAVGSSQVNVPTEVDLSDLDGSVVSMATGGTFTAYLTNEGSVFYSGCGLQTMNSSRKNLNSPKLKRLFQVPGPVSTSETRLSAGLHYLMLKLNIKDPFALLWGSYNSHQIVHLPRHDEAPHKIPIIASNNYCSGKLTIDALLS